MDTFPKIGLLILDYHLPVSGSLKSKRRPVKSLKDRIRSRFNVSVAEIGELDKWQRATLGVCMIGNDRIKIEQDLHRILNLASETPEMELLTHHLEFV